MGGGEEEVSRDTIEVLLILDTLSVGWALRGQLTHPWPLHSPFAPWEISGIERAGASVQSLNLISLKLLKE